MDHFWVVNVAVAYEYDDAVSYHREKGAAISAAEKVAQEEFTGWLDPVPEPTIEEGLPNWHRRDKCVYVTKAGFSDDV